jgi:5'-deoxynucleotidase YfbR-like HD superfamily hydrolase
LFERDLRTLSFVPRWVITKNLKTQSVAEHSFYVAVYAGQLAEHLGFEGDMGDLYHAALWHDAEECFTGDIPGPTKRSIQGEMADIWVRDGVAARFPGSVRPVTAEIKLILKIANLLDEVFYKATEIQMGNRGAQQSYQTSITRLFRAINMLPLTDTGRKVVWRIAEDAANLHLAGQDKLPENSDDLAPRN